MMDVSKQRVTASVNLYRVACSSVPPGCWRVFVLPGFFFFFFFPFSPWLFSAAAGETLTDASSLYPQALLACGVGWGRV